MRYAGLLQQQAHLECKAREKTQNSQFLARANQGTQVSLLGYGEASVLLLSLLCGHLHLGDVRQERDLDAAVLAPSLPGPV